jgi:hypothetical protein
MNSPRKLHEGRLRGRGGLTISRSAIVGWPLPGTTASKLRVGRQFIQRMDRAATVRTGGLLRLSRGEVIRFLGLRSRS